MYVTICTDDGKTAMVEVDAETEVSTIKLLGEIELGLSVENIVAIHNSVPLHDSSTLSSCGISNNDIILLKLRKRGASSIEDTPLGRYMPSAASNSFTPRHDQDPTAMLSFFKTNPQELKHLHHRNPALADAIETGDVNKIRTTIMMQQIGLHKTKWETEQTYKKAESDPDNEENQRKLQALIHKEMIDKSYERAMEETPEVFGRVTMLYIDIKVNNHPIKAFVDSGAQATIMSLDCARASGLEHLIDKRFQGEARGVGTARIPGRIHIAQLEIGKAYFDCSLTILERNDIDFLLGLDMLRRHQCVIDLKQGCLHIGSGNVTVPFLAEKDLPSSAREQVLPLPDLNLDSSKKVSDKKQIMPLPTPGIPVDSNASEWMSLLPKIAQLTAMGFTENQAKSALQLSGGNVELAATLLFEQMG